MAAVLAGLTLSFVLGIPLGSVAGEWFGWRATFGFSGGLALAAAAAIAAVLPPVPGWGRARCRSPVRRSRTGRARLRSRPGDPVSSPDHPSRAGRSANDRRGQAPGCGVIPKG